MSRNKEDAKKQADEILAMEPENINALALKANIELIDGDFDQVAQTIETALALDPNLDRLYSIQGRLFVAQKNNAAAICKSQLSQQRYIIK